MFKLIIYIVTILFSVATNANPKAHLFGIERGLMDGLSLHFTPKSFDFAISYAILLPPSETDDVPSAAWPYYEIVEKENVMTQTALRAGYYFERYGIDSFYINLFFGQINIKQTRTSTTLGARTGEGIGTFIAPGFGYHVFGDNFNVRLGLAVGQINYTVIDFKNKSGAVVEQMLPFEIASNNIGGGLDLSIGWAF